MKDNKGQGDSPVGKDTCCLSLMTMEPWNHGLKEKSQMHICIPDMAVSRWDPGKGEEMARS